jgi:multiple sugar transport system permease protein
VIWIMIGYFESTPMELEEAAVIDGATRWQVLPPRRPADRQARHHGGLHPRGDLLRGTTSSFGVVLAGRETRTLPGRRSTTCCPSSS